jgi:hypothetical protein
MGDEFINNIPRYCLWLKDSTASDRVNSPEIKTRIEQVRKTRLKSHREATQNLAKFPYLFGEIRQTDQNYLAVPAVSSENRFYIPIANLEANVICGNKLYIIPNASLYDFGILTSHMHNAWMRTVAGRLKSDYSYANTVVYNNFLFPEIVKALQKKKIEDSVQTILDARKAEEQKCVAQNQKCSLAMLYDADGMPAELVKAHNALDKAVDAAYGYQGEKDDASRVAFLFELYQKLTAPLMEVEPAKKVRKTTKKPQAEN